MVLLVISGCGVVVKQGEMEANQAFHERLSLTNREHEIPPPPLHNIYYTYCAIVTLVIYWTRRGQRHLVINFTVLFTFYVRWLCNWYVETRNSSASSRV